MTECHSRVALSWETFGRLRQRLFSSTKIAPGADWAHSHELPNSCEQVTQQPAWLWEESQSQVAALLCYVDLIWQRRAKWLSRFKKLWATVEGLTEPWSLEGSDPGNALWSYIAAVEFFMDFIIMAFSFSSMHMFISLFPNKHPSL